jgi:hypothetical protein
MNKQDPKILDLTALYNVAVEIIQNYKEQLEIDNVNATDNLLNSIQWSIIEKDDLLTLEMQIADYFIYTEYGRNPTQGQSIKWENPVEDIKRWYRKKSAKGKLIPKPNQTIPTTEKEIEKVAYAIVNKIHKYGYYGTTSEGKHSLEKAMKRSKEEELIDRFAMALTQPLAGEVVAEIKTLEIRKKPNVRPKK